MLFINSASLYDWSAMNTCSQDLCVCTSTNSASLCNWSTIERYCSQDSVCVCACVHVCASTDSASFYNWSMMDTCTQDSCVLSQTVPSSGVL